MCGIVGYNGFRDADKILIDCLKKLEYRGYDSAGIGVIGKKLQIFKDVGEISKLEKKIPHIEGCIGISHTRWATMGAVTKENAHPHLSSNKKIAVIHNGIIENYKKLREELEKQGVKFRSQTDSEIIAHLIEKNYNGNLENAVFQTLKKLKGSYAIAVICEDEPNKLVGARNESPLVVGIGDNENFLASDIPALLKYTNRVIFIDDGEVCVLTKNSVKVFNKNKKEVKKKEELIEWDIKDAEKSGFPHFMLKEIYDQPDTINQALRGRISEIERSINFPDNVEKLLNNSLDSIYIVACGTSFYAGLVGKYLIEQLTGIPVSVELSSEYRYFGTKKETSLVIAITQSGETADTLAALREAKSSGCKTLVITNVIGSTAIRIADGYILTQSGPEIGVAATKTFISQIIVLFLVALKIGSINNKVGSDELYQYMLHLRDLPKQVRAILDRSDDIIDIAKQIKDSQSIFFIGRGINYPLSLEGALKLKEISYIHAEGFAAGELKHGPFALLTKNTPVVAIVTRDFTYDKMLANIGEVKTRGPMVIAIADENDTEIDKYADFIIRYPSNQTMLSCITITVLLQLLAYHVANLKGCSIDKPRNLAKSVTVE
ncbi:MAG: glutamine--fructose-6-phosphate transaminase (isomerizing) [Candidatus Thermoplasmatota archaeon]|nr:glutamine--fructose-6-phosphate transaminase (isomerizing) [Candidatus Thermoplasmatota archaeon]